MADDELTTKALEKIAGFEAEIARLRIFVNEADKLNGREPRFGDVYAAQAVVGGGGGGHRGKRWQAGDFFNKPFATAVRQILVARYEAAGAPSPASVEEVYDALVQGSFGFETSGQDAQRNSIKISLGKNSAMFVRLPNSDRYGLADWYGKKPKLQRKSPSVAPGIPGDDEAFEAGTSDDEGEQADA